MCDKFFAVLILGGVVGVVISFWRFEVVDLEFNARDSDRSAE